MKDERTEKQRGRHQAAWVRRLMAMDALLDGDGVNVPTFAEEWRTSEKSIHRDLVMLRLLGCETEVTHDGTTDRYFQRYVKKGRLFDQEAAKRILDG